MSWQAIVYGGANPYKMDGWLGLQRKIMHRDSFRCRACRGRSNLTVHHINPRAWGGSDEERNLITLCIRCHDQAEIQTEEFKRPLTTDELEAVHRRILKEEEVTPEKPKLISNAPQRSFQETVYAPVVPEADLLERRYVDEGRTPKQIARMKAFKGWSEADVIEALLSLGLEVNGHAPADCVSMGQAVMDRDQITECGHIRIGRSGSGDE